MNWRENWNSGGPIGFGNASTLYENGYYYTVSEGPDINLGCIAGQNWDLGLFRSASLTNTNWEQLPAGNPFLYSSKLVETSDGKTMPCSLAYANLFRDPLTQNIYLMYGRSSYNNDFDGIYFYQLVPKNNLLQNGDLWKCDSENWLQISPGKNTTSLTIERIPNKSSDYNCYLAANCGASSCEAGQSVYQDVDISSLSPRNISYGGKFAVDSGT